MAPWWAIPWKNTTPPPCLKRPRLSEEYSVKVTSVAQTKAVPKSKAGWQKPQTTSRSSYGARMRRKLGREAEGRHDRKTEDPNPWPMEASQATDFSSFDNAGTSASSSSRDKGPCSESSSSRDNAVKAKKLLRSVNAKGELLGLDDPEI